MFAVKNWLGHLLLPLPLLGSIFLLGLGLSMRPATARMGRRMAAFAGLAVFALSLPPLPTMMMRPLEMHYPRLTDGQAVKLARRDGMQWIVVLGASSSRDPALPVAEQLSAAGVRRLRTAVHLQRLIPGSRLLLSGGNPLGGTADARVMAAVAAEMGVRDAAMHLEVDSQDTAQQARLLAPILGHRPFLLVTSAAHMPRAMALFKKRGLAPVAAPTDFTAVQESPWHLIDELPAAANLAMAARAMHEYLGLVFARLTGQADWPWMPLGSYGRPASS